MEAQISAQKHKKYEKKIQGAMTPPKIIVLY
jgi:hypothetical protein